MILKIIILLLLSFISGLLTYFIFKLDNKTPGKYGLTAFREIKERLTRHEIYNPTSNNTRKALLSVFNHFFPLHNLFDSFYSF